MDILLLIAIASAIYFYLKYLSDDNHKLYVSNLWIQLPKGLDFVENGYNIYFWKPIGKHELHAFTSTSNFSSKTEVYLGQVTQEVAHKLFQAIDRGGVNYGFVNEITNTGSLLIVCQSKTSGHKNAWGFIEKWGFERIEKDFKKDFNLDVVKGQDGKEAYKTGVIPKRPEEIEREEQLRDWCNRLETWWQKKTKGETNEYFEGLREGSLTIFHHSLYRRVTGEMITKPQARGAERTPEEIKIKEWTAKVRDWTDQRFKGKVKWLPEVFCSMSDTEERIFCWSLEQLDKKFEERVTKALEEVMLADADESDLAESILDAYTRELEEWKAEEEKFFNGDWSEIEGFTSDEENGLVYSK